MTQAMKLADGDNILINGLSDIDDKYDAYILDVWGVIHNGIKPFPHTISTLKTLHEKGKKVLLLSNTPDRSQIIIDRLALMDINRELYTEVMTAGESAWRGLKNRNDEFHKKIGNKCYFAGGDFERGRKSFTEGLDIEFVSEASQAGFILNACGGQKTEEYDEMWRMTNEALKHNLPMICTNPDLIVNVGDEQFECAGTFAKYYEENGGEVLYHGKPHTPIYEVSWDLLGKPDKSRILAIGDSLHTDIQGANRFGIDSIFNFSGIHGQELSSPEAINALIESQAHKPTYCMEELSF